MKILLTHPKLSSALGRLALDMVKYNPHHDIRLAEVHPKRPDERQLQNFIELYDWCDVWDCQYWKTGKKLKEIFGEKITTKPTILAHHNPYDLLAEEWKDYTINVVSNSSQKKVLPYARQIPLTIDLENFPWNQEYTERKTVMMVAQRIEGSKGIEPVARACRELGYQFILVGEVSDANYFQEIVKHGITFLEKISDEELLEAYKGAAIHVCNSKDNFESGTLPILEAMAVGVPVLTRRVGHVPDLDNEKNMVVREGDPEDVEELKALIAGLMEDRERRLQMREEAWHTVRNLGAERRARAYSGLYYELGHKNNLVSIIMPVFGHSEQILANLEAIGKQTYRALELVIVSDGDEEFDKFDWLALANELDITIKYFNVGTKEKYGLAYARDFGVMESEGEITVFMDQRFIPEPTAIEELVKNLVSKTWVYGNKNNKRNFVENFSAIYRQEFIEMGMSNHLMEGYGGMSQELRERSKRQGFRHVFIEKAVANAIYSSHNYNKRKTEIREMKNRLWKLNLT